MRALLSMLEQLVLLADCSFDARVHLEVARNRGQVLVVLARGLLVWEKAP